MKEGNKGRRGCCDNPFEILGVSAVDNPQYEPLADNIGFAWLPQQNIGLPYDVKGDGNYKDDATTTYTGNLELKPVVADPNPDGEMPPLHAVKLPSSYPYSECDLNPPTSSAAPGAKRHWSADIGSVSQHRMDGDDGFIGGWSYVWRSRWTYEDGEEAFATYVKRGKSIATDASAPLAVFYDEPHANPPYHRHGDHYIVDAGDPDTVAYFNTEWWDSGAPFYSPTTAMEDVYRLNFPGDVFAASADNFPNYFPVNSVCYSRDYYLVSTYSPEVDSFWTVMRVKYEGTRLGDPGLEIFASDLVGDDGVTYQSPYLIMLPSVRTWIDTALDPSLKQCWVCAKTITGPPQLVTGVWTDKVYRSGVGSGDELTGLADGTLTEAQNIIIGDSDIGDQAASDFPDETWSDIRVRCYNRMWDYTQNKCVDLLLFTTGGTPETQSDLVADFETPSGGMFDNAYFDHGIDGFLSFVATGTDGNTWITDAEQNHTSGGTLAARSEEQDVTKEGECDLSIRMNVMTAGQVKFWYMLDNRKYGERVPPFTILTNFPEPDNQLRVLIDGTMVDFNIDGTDFTAGPIDNVTIPSAFGDGSDYLVWRQVTVNVPAGTHTLAIRLVRKWQDNGHLVAWVDDFEFPEVMVGDDVTGQQRYYFDGTRVRKADQWTWAIRNDENHDDIASRVKTVPDYIAMDEFGRIVYGNPHYFVVTEDGVPVADYGGDRYDDNKREAGGGYVRFTASNNTNADVPPPCYDPDGAIVHIDPTDDPPWGSAEFLTPRGSGGIQTRGMNGCLRDATEIPIPLRRFMYTKTQPEKFASLVRSAGHWSERAHGWTVKDEGHRRIPHLQVLWRPNFVQPAHPETAWPHNPYASDFENSDLDDITAWGDAAMRVRDDRFINPVSSRPRYSRTNWLIQSPYSDCFMIQPQYVWARITADPVADTDNYWDADTAAGDGGHGPWPSAQWILIQARFCPVGFYWFIITPPAFPDPLCPYTPGDDETDESHEPLPPGIPIDVTGPVVRINLGRGVPFPDFDCCMCNCDCCKPHERQPDLTGTTF